MLRSAGADRDEIATITGFSPRKVERSIVEGRANLRTAEVQLGAGRRCGPMQELIDRTIEGEASSSDRRRLSRHVRHCAACRASYRTQRDQARLLASFVPGFLVASPDLTSTLAPDPTLALSWWDRASTGATVRAGQMMQVWFDIPALASSKAGATAIVAAAAGALGAPMVVQAMRDDPPPRPAPVATRAPVSRPPVTITVPAAPRPVPARPAARTAPKRAPAQRSAPRRRSTPTTRLTTSASTAPRRTSSPPPITYTAPTRSAPAPTRSSGGTSSSSTAAQEFGP